MQNNHQDAQNDHKHTKNHKDTETPSSGNIWVQKFNNNFPMGINKLFKSVEFEKEM